MNVADRSNVRQTIESGTELEQGAGTNKKSIEVPPRSCDELKLAARLCEMVKDVPDIREDLCADIKQQIDDGTYLTDERLEVAAERMIDEVLAEVDAELGLA